MYIFKEENELVNIIKNQLNYDNIDELDISVDLSNLDDYVDEYGYINESLLDSEVSIEISVTDPEDELNDGDTYSIYIDLSELVE